MGNGGGFEGAKAERRAATRKFWLGVGALCYYVLNSVVQNELFSALEKGQGHKKFDKPFFIVWWNHCFLIIVLPPVLIYLALTGGSPPSTSATSDRDGGKWNESKKVRRDSDDESEARPLLSQGLQWEGPTPRPPAGVARITWYLEAHGVGWRWLCWTGLWCGLLFLELNYLWYLGLPMPGMLPSEASAAANSSFAWVYVLSLCLLGEKVDWVKVLAVIGTLVGVVLLAISSLQGAGFSIGVIVEFGCAVSQAFYFVAFRKWAVQKGRLPALISALVTGFMGLAHLLFFWPGFAIVNYADWWLIHEKFTLPDTEQFQTLALGAAITSTGCIALMLGIALLPNPLAVSVATLVTTPAQYIGDLICHPSTTKGMGLYTHIGGGIIVATFALIIARDYYLIQRRGLDSPKALSVQ